MPAWFEVTVDVPVELSEAMASHLFDLGAPGLQCVDGDGITSLIAYFPDQPPIDRLEHLCAQVSRDAGQAWSPAIRSRTLDEQDWAEDWKRHFKPTRVGQRLYICPPWDTAGTDGRINLIIHPGMAFGTGQHPTTRGCLELIEEATAALDVGRALDVGTGSGILSIALAKLGVQHVVAVDNDPQACTIAAENSVLNGTEAILLITDDWKAITGGFDLIVANLFTNLLCEFSDRLQSLLTRRGSLICSGFLNTDEASIIAAYPRLTVVRRREEENWVTLMLTADGSAA